MATMKAVQAPKAGADFEVVEREIPQPGAGHMRIHGYRVAAVGRGSGSATLAKKLGEDAYIDSAATDPAAELQKLGGATVILATAPSGKAMSALVGGIGVNGTMVVVGASMDPIEVLPNQLLFGKNGIKGWAGGISTDSQDTLRFAEMTGVRPRIEKYPLAKAAEGYARMMSGKAEFRVVLTV
jgi:D-arabinose 1-dehydrogenase-like Zn-dependent alcohol dehydrogenase